MNERKRGVLSWSIVAVMLVLRIPLRGGLVNIGLPGGWINLVFEVGTYLLTALFIWLNFERLADFHVDTFSLLFVIFSVPVWTLILRGYGPDSPFTFPLVPSLILWAISLGLILLLVVKRKRISRMKARDWIWLLGGLLAGLLTSALLAYPTSLTLSGEDVYHWPSVRATFNKLPLDFLFQIGYAGVIEEPLFRGFLWGLLKRAKVRDVWIWLIQTGLFMLAHLYYFFSREYAIYFWIMVPAGGLVLGWLAWRSRSIAPGIVAHGAANATGLVFGQFLVLISKGLFRL